MPRPFHFIEPIRRTDPKVVRTISRDPCARCGVRGDVQCGHSHRPLSVAA